MLKHAQLRQELKELNSQPSKRITEDLKRVEVCEERAAVTQVAATDGEIEAGGRERRGEM
eukprot:765543-Hanusia_phi.AAC.3